jgi:hypothetical protein
LSATGAPAVVVSTGFFDIASQAPPARRDMQARHGSP